MGELFGLNREEAGLGGELLLEEASTGTHLFEAEGLSLRLLALKVLGDLDVAILAILLEGGGAN